MEIASEKRTLFENMEPEAFPEKLHQLLMEASLFYHVPYAYLVPDSHLIGEKEIRFFSVDPNWVIALLDGICSVGRNASIDYTHDSKLIYQEYESAVRQNQDVRRNKQGKEKSIDEAETVPAVSGFLLNSPISEQYRGLEFRAYDQVKEGEKLTPLRIEKLGKQLLVGIFLGKMKRLEIAMPPEGLHYGVIKKDGILKKRLRSLESGELSEETEIPVTLKEEGPEQIIDICKTAQTLKMALGVQEITSAEIGVELIQNAQTAVFGLMTEGETDYE